MQLTVFDYLPKEERPADICERLFKPKRGPRMMVGYAAEAAKAISDRIQAEPIAVELEQLTPVCSEQTPTLVHSTPVSSPGVTAPEPAAKVVLGIPLGHSHPGLGINKPVCFYCKGQSELEYAGLFPNAIKTMNHHIWRCKKQPRHQLVCAEKGDWWYQWCGGVGYGVTYGVPEPWMWKDVFQQALEVEAAELRAKISEVHEIRLRQKKIEELKRQREQIGNKISEVMGRGFSRTNDEEAAHFQKKYDRASEAIRALEEQIPTIIPATWRWEERLAEIEKVLGKGRGL